MLNGALYSASQVDYLGGTIAPVYFCCGSKNKTPEVMFNSQFSKFCLPLKLYSYLFIYQIPPIEVISYT